MTQILTLSPERTLDRLVEMLSGPGFAGSRAELWVFEDLAARRDAETRLALAGVHAHVRSAYQPLVHALLDEIDLTDANEVVIRFPVAAVGPPLRFRAEAYPAPDLVGGAALTYAIGRPGRDYHVEVHRSGRPVVVTEVFAPNRPAQDAYGEPVLRPTGWLRVTGRPDGLPPIDEPVLTEFEEAFDAVMVAVAAHDFGASQPLFGALEIHAALPGIERPLGVGHETASTAEALHEDLYFSLCERLQHDRGVARGDRQFQPGQIVPDVTVAAQPRVTVTVCPVVREDLPDETSVALDTAPAPLSPGQIAAELAALGGTPFSGLSRQGRPVAGTHLDRGGPGIVVTAGQHANETTGVVGLLRAARVLAADPTRNVALIPLENPDGYALHRRLRKTHPAHMHHAARFTAAGDDLEYRTRAPLWETEARIDAIARTGARLHVNLHGYPAHAWWRPFSGMIPPGSEAWTLPRGFFLIIRHHPGLGEPARAYAEAMARRMAEIPGIAELNARQIAAYERHLGPVPQEVLHGIPVSLFEAPLARVPFTLITEFPDETVAGDDFVLGHTVQREAVLAAIALFDPAVA